ncbi:hypothetical protein, partial [Acinetobacter sp.]|uniref:hypothetical protein n=1 Tax=Acinetobacter sp. TaxID=472 RepID=UPI002FC5DB24
VSEACGVGSSPAERTILYHKINKRFIFRTVQNFPEKIAEFFRASHQFCQILFLVDYSLF